MISISTPREGKGGQYHGNIFLNGSETSNSKSYKSLPFFDVWRRGLCWSHSLCAISFFPSESVWIIRAIKLYDWTLIITWLLTGREQCLRLSDGADFLRHRFSVSVQSQGLMFYLCGGLGIEVWLPARLGGQLAGAFPEFLIRLGRCPDKASSPFQDWHWPAFCTPRALQPPAPQRPAFCTPRAPQPSQRLALWASTVAGCPAVEGQACSPSALTWHQSAQVPKPRRLL